LRHFNKPFALQTPWAAAAVIRSTGLDTYSVAISARNLRNGKTVKCMVGGGDDPSNGVVVKSLVVRQTGSMAWAGTRWGNEVGGSTAFGARVTAVSTCIANKGQVLDAGNGIDPATLALHGSGLTWMDSGVAHSATLH